ncbi:EKC/KEOPS complex subunit bud32 [Linum perenne]
MDTEEGVRDGSMVLIKQGAEARVFESNFVGKRCVIKERFSKKYRHPTLDAKLTLKRLNAEARCMTKARRLGVTTPVLYAYIDGTAVKDVLLEFGSNGVVEERLDDIAVQIGDAIAKLHDGGLIHGDLTTSNMLIRTGSNQLVLIDFGLSFTSTLPEDKAMDRILAAYRKSSKQWSATFNKLAQVRQRGRKRTMVG